MIKFIIFKSNQVTIKLRRNFMNRISSREPGLRWKAHQTLEAQG